MCACTFHNSILHDVRVTWNPPPVNIYVGAIFSHRHSLEAWFPSLFSFTSVLPTFPFSRSLPVWVIAFTGCGLLTALKCKPVQCKVVGAGRRQQEEWDEGVDGGFFLSGLMSQGKVCRSDSLNHLCCSDPFLPSSFSFQTTFPLSVLGDFRWHCWTGGWQSGSFTVTAWKALIDSRD